MDRDKFRKLPVRTDGAHNIELETDFIHPDYEVAAADKEETTDTGWLVLFRVVPKAASLPGFVARWEDRTEDVDVDPQPLDCIPCNDWKGQTAGYSGHHTTRVSESPRVYEVDLHVPGIGRVFRGYIRFNIAIGARIGDTLTTTDTASAELLPHETPPEG